MVDKQEVLDKHRLHKGKIEVLGKVPVETKEDLSTYYTPGVAYVSEAINANVDTAYEYTNKGNTLAIVSDGTRILGLGDVGPEAGLAVMEGKALLFKKFGGVDAVPLCIRKSTEEEIVTFLKQIEPTYGAINIEDIESPKVLGIVKKAATELGIPVFHDDQQGTSAVVLAALTNALRLVGKDKSVKITVMGAGSAGMGIARLLSFTGFKNIYVLDSSGIIYRGRAKGMNEFKEELANATNPENVQGGLEDAIKGADVFIGVSGIAGALNKELIKTMSERPIVFGLSNPTPEISYADAVEAGAFIVATGRSDTPNQINNVVSFPGISRGLLEVHAKTVTPEMLVAAANAMAKSVGRRLSREMIIPSMVDKTDAIKITQSVAAAVGMKAVEQGAARVIKTDDEIRRSTKELIMRYRKIEKRCSVSKNKKKKEN